MNLLLTYGNHCHICVNLLKSLFMYFQKTIIDYEFSLFSVVLPLIILLKEEKKEV